MQGVGPNVTYHNGYLFHVGFTLLIPGQAVVVGSAAPGMAMLFIHPAQIYGAELPATIGFDVLLGMDVISSGSLKIEGNGHYSFSF